jgi:hypothetical protein
MMTFEIAAFASVCALATALILMLAVSKRP